MFEKDLQSKKAIFISGHTGWGKTTAVIDWLNTSNRSYEYFCADQQDFADCLSEVTGEIVVIDDLHCLMSRAEQLILNALIAPGNRRFIIISRGVLPGFLKPFQLKSQLTVYDIESLRFDRSMISELLVLHKLIAPTLPSQVEHITNGYVIAVRFLINRLANGAPMDTHTVERARIDVFDFYDEILFKRWDSDLQKFLLHMAPFDRFTEKMAGMVTGRKNVVSTIEKALSGGSYFTFQPPDFYSVHPLFHNYLMRKQRLICAQDFIASTYHNAALYYELEDDIENALKYYQLSGDTDKISELLILNSQLHPGNGHYYETETYYRVLPKETILASPALMSGMCMLCSLCCQPEESESWFSELENYAVRLDKSDKNYELAQGQLCYLKIALPHRGNKRLAAILLDAAKAYRKGSFHLQEFSVTSNMPSVINGGKDFCE